MGMTPESPPIMMTDQRFMLPLVADPARFAAVRRVVRARLILWGHACLADEAAVCVTEILANVHRHVGSPECELLLQGLPDGVLAAVSDRSPVRPVVVADSGSLGEGGRGMLLVASVAEAWGVSPTEAGKQVWVKLRLPDADADGVAAR